MFHNLDQLRLQLKRENLHEVNAKTCLEVLRTQFKEFFALKGVNSSDHLYQYWQQDFEEYMLCEPDTYRRDLLDYLDTLKAVIHRAVITYGILRMKENEVNALKVTTKEGIVIKLPGKFRGYKLATKKEVEENEGLKEVWEQMEYVISNIDSDLESTAKPNPDVAAIITQQLQNILPHIVTQVTANVNNVNEGYRNGGNNGCSYKTFTACNPKEFDGKGGAVALTHWIEKIESMFNNCGCIANQRRYIHALAPQICGMLRETQPTTIQSAILMAGILTDEAVRCGTLTKGNDKRKEMQVAPVNAVKMGQNQRACYECGSLDHLCYDCPKWKQATRQAKNPLALEGNKNTRNNGGQARGKAFNGNAFAPLLNVEPCIVNHGYVIKIADGKSVEVDRVIHDYKLELRNSLFVIDLIPLGHGSFDVIVGMDWLSKNKAVIVCHEKGSLIGPKLVLETTNKVALIKEKLKAAGDRQKSYADKRCKSLEFEVGGQVLLKVSPWKGVVCFGKKEVSGGPNLHVPLDEIKVDKTLRFAEKHVEIMDREIKKLKRRKITLVKVRWDSKCGPDLLGSIKIR
uniref:Putative reverse transcriptase domain-containing protein n=1 Tax=Tanacetum cinerariifolium TaxID=118510 RepID=A0A6L2MPN9_TANCI|nr:putative reverse transcriptase domain-containing protein [Tanacetum cinerariifolium]